MFKDMEAIGKLPPAHGINSVHLAQGEMTDDYSACFTPCPLQLAKNTIYPPPRGGGRVSERVTDTEAVIRQDRKMLKCRKRLLE